MNDTLQIAIKSVYGRETIYPVNDQARRLAEMVATKTLTERTLRGAMGMGFKIEYVDARRLMAHGSPARTPFGEVTL